MFNLIKLTKLTWLQCMREGFVFKNFRRVLVFTPAQVEPTFKDCPAAALQHDRCAPGQSCGRFMASI